jgi:hypothetical protein
MRDKKNGYVISLRIRELDGWEGSNDVDDKECGDWIELAQNRAQGRAFLDTIISFRVSQKVGNFLFG